ncbi:hypothetical protein BJ138DRAFT_1006068 [Hygrophoropsis aurantiaca]|uniref:Uncharacterized protein n=1 Tax=Hygrophoropsis aurantiaca TaxID=72124 RepID=A0ACB8AGL5_9AGAM|nr:hypothetical protein BJ138DRAFT_1006068 [Hygrophoropsis aurantiaca]
MSELDEEDEVQRVLQVSFFPPLYLQRRIWVLDILRRENVDSLIDIGCGEGELLATLCQPAPWLRPDPNSRVTVGEENPINLRLTHVAGLDIASRELSEAIQVTAPSANPTYERWEPLCVKIWKGGLETLNPEFVGADCIVSTEVIEHLPEEILDEFAPVLLGVYHPRLLLISTPSYNFNARFSPPGTERPDGYPDPTGRTNRIFRHHDHKFEWDTEEFGRWCKDVAREWGYSARVDTIGTAQERDEWGRDEELGGATQVAAFRRLDDPNSVTEREKKGKVVMKERAENRKEHELLAMHQYPVHPSAGKPQPLAEIEKAIIAQFKEIGEVIVRQEEMWFLGDVKIRCGGCIEAMIEAIEESPKLRLQRDGWDKRGDWKIELVGGIQQANAIWTNSEQARGNEKEQANEELEWNQTKTLWDDGKGLGEEGIWSTEDSNWAREENGSSWAGSWDDSGANVWEVQSDKED